MRTNAVRPIIAQPQLPKIESSHANTAKRGRDAKVNQPYSIAFTKTGSIDLSVVYVFGPI